MPCDVDIPPKPILRRFSPRESADIGVLVPKAFFAYVIGETVKVDQGLDEHEPVVFVLIDSPKPAFAHALRPALSAAMTL